MKFPFVLPSQFPEAPLPIWTEKGFHVGNEIFPVLEYSSNHQGWSDELTFFHEETAGEDHFMDLASRSHAIRQVRAHCRQSSPVILEVGCSSGFMLRSLLAHFPNAFVMGSDVVGEPLQKLAASLPHLPLFRFDLTHCPLPDNSIDVVILLNVLEHIKNDEAAMRQVYRILKPGGVAIIEAPASPHLYDAYDEMLCHFRRYTLASLCSLAAQSAFHITKATHLGCFIYPGFWLVKKKNRKLLSKEEAVKRSLVEKNIRQTGCNPILKLLIKLELAIGKRVSYSFGIRCLLSCTKPKLQ